MRKVLILLSLCASFAAWAEPSLNDVRATVNKGDYAGAETMMRDVLAQHPKSAKVHYIYAEILAHLGRKNEAAQHAMQAKKLDPEIHFTAPDKFRAFEAELLASSNTSR